MPLDPPVGWSISPLERVATLQRGFDLPIHEREEGEVPVYGSNGIDGWHVRAAVAGPGVITGRSGTIGSIYFETRDYWPLNTTLYVRDFHGNEPRFIARLLESLGLQRFAASTGVPSLNRNFVHPTPVLLPPPREQARIAAVLDTVDQAIAKTEAVIAKLKQVRAGLLHDLLTRGLDEHGQLRDPAANPEQFQELLLGRIPLEWETPTLDESAEKIQDGTHFSPKSTTGPRRYVTSKNIRFGYIDLSGCGWISEAEHREIYRRCNVSKNDVLLTKDGANTGNAALNTLEEEFSLLSSVALIRCCQGSLHPSFLVHYLLSPIGQKRLKDLMSGNAITRLTLARIKEFRIPRPPFSEQTRIAEKLGVLDAQMYATESELAKLRQLRRGLACDLLTGHVRVPEGIEVGS